MAILFLFQKNLRLYDNAALAAAMEQEQPIVPVYLLDEPLGKAQQWWLHHSLHALSQELAEQNMPLLFYEGKGEDLIELFKKEISDLTIFASQSKPSWKKTGVPIELFEDNYLFPAASLEKEYKRYTPFFNYVSKKEVSKPLAKKKFKSIHIPKKELFQKKLSTYNPKNTIEPYSNFWEPGEKGAQNAWNTFFKKHLITYDQSRDIPALNQSSHLSPYLHFGEISVRQIWHALEELPPSSSKKRFMQELVWREFSAHLLHHAPEMAQVPLQQKFKNFPWTYNQAYFNAWKEGKTGLPIVDAGMRELRATGFMQNRVRMIVASFLTKHLLIDWKQGAAWFFEHLLDADKANNIGNWQWVAGCGADAAPFFRIFNPLLQAKKYDPEARYIKQWIPELKNLSAKEILVTDQNKMKIIPLYPQPIIDLEECRNRALYEFKNL